MKKTFIKNITILSAIALISSSLMSGNVFADESESSETTEFYSGDKTASQNNYIFVRDKFEDTNLDLALGSSASTAKWEFVYASAGTNNIKMGMEFLNKKVDSTNNIVDSSEKNKKTVVEHSGEKVNTYKPVIENTLKNSNVYLSNTTVKSSEVESKSESESTVKKTDIPNNSMDSIEKKSDVYSSNTTVKNNEAESKVGISNTVDTNKDTRDTAFKETSDKSDFKTYTKVNSSTEIVKENRSNVNNYSKNVYQGVRNLTYATTYKSDTEGKWVHDGKNWTYKSLIEEKNYIGWIISNGRWYYLNNDGILQTGWQYIDGSWYLFHYTDDATLGAMEVGWNNYNDHWYNLSDIDDNTMGIMYVNTLTPDGYRVGEDGSWNGESKIVQ